MSWGRIGFNPPGRLRLGEVHELHLVLSPSGDEAELAELVPSTGASAQPETHRVRFSDRMVARLEADGPGVRITPISPELQAVSGVEPTTWIWTVRGAEGGTTRLRLTLDAILEVDGERVPRSIRTFNHSIEVTVSPWQRVLGNPLAIGLALLLLLGVVAVPLLRARRGRAGGGWAAPSGLPPAPPREGGHEVFISHSSRDRPVAETICRTLEEGGVPCWIAPRDIRPGDAWDEAIIDAIEGARVMVLVLSEQSNSSKQVTKEVRNAVESGVTVIPFRTEDVTLSKALRFHISSAHWLDAARGSREEHLRELLEIVRASAPAGTR